MSGVDYYDVQRMVEQEAGDRRRAIDELRDLIVTRTRETDAELAELSERIGNLGAATAAALEDLQALSRVLESRTAHLA